MPTRQRSDLLAPELIEQQVGDHQAEHAVAEELHPFVATAAPTGLALKARVRERLFEQRRARNS